MPSILLNKPIVILSLSENNFHIFPEELNKVKKTLMRLYFRKNKIEELPASIGELAKLEILSLTNNKLTHLPNSLLKLRKLRKISIINNQFIEFPDVLIKLIKQAGNNEKFDLLLGKNAISSVPSTIGECGNRLFYLDLSNNNLTKLPDEMGKLIGLDGLDLSGNKELFKEMTPEKLNSIFKNYTKARIINLSDCGFDKKADQDKIQGDLKISFNFDEKYLTPEHRFPKKDYLKL